MSWAAGLLFRNMCFFVSRIAVVSSREKAHGGSVIGRVRADRGGYPCACDVTFSQYEAPTLSFKGFASGRGQEV